LINPTKSEAFRSKKSFDEGDFSCKKSFDEGVAWTEVCKIELRHTMENKVRAQGMNVIDAEFTADEATGFKP
jgi:hypothetical protein